MGFLRRKHLVRKLLAAALVLGGVLAWFTLRRGGQRYVPGERSEGLFDSLGRKLPDDRPAVSFSEVAESAGLRFRHLPAVRSNRLPEDMGPGVALGDVDGDGWTDIVVAIPASKDNPEAGSVRCYRNRPELWKK